MTGVQTCALPISLKAVANAVALEAVAKMAFLTFGLSPQVASLPEYLCDKHFGRKHGPDAYYGQKSE